MSRKLVDAWFGAFRAKDLSGLELAEDFVHSSPFGEVRGRDSYLEMVRENPDIFFTKTIDIVDVFDCGDKLAVRYQVDQTSACEFIYVRNGKIARIDAYYHFGEKPVLPALSRWYSD